VKIGVTLRPDLLALLEADLPAVLERRPEVLIPVVATCVEAKGEVVSRDERDEDVRGILNYGHTIGHALEAQGKGRYRHGEAVAIGMAGAAWIGEQMQVTLPEVPRRQNALLEGLGLKLTAPGADKKAVARNLRLDKKVRAKNIRFVLTLQIGGASVWPHIPERLLRDAVRWVTS
jgi:3-dehydroquinate synthase